MFIKQIVIQGFKSFRDQTIVEPFNPHHNVIVGANGSGKSNFFFAIRFVLSDHFSSLSDTDRKRLLHEGAGNVLSAYVEVIFDNSDARIPYDSDEVIIRRTIGLTKDEYSLGRKSSSASDVFALLEAAGFSRSHPYYIVQQGKVEALATMTDAGRLGVLHEIAGSAVYQLRREESLKILDSSRADKERIDESLERVDERLSELNSEKNELKEYQELDKKKRALEHVVYNNSLNTVRAQIDHVEVTRRHELSKANEDNLRAHETAELIRNKESELATITTKASTLKSLLTQLEDEKNDLVRRKAQLSLDLDQSKEIHRVKTTELTQLTTEYDNLCTDINTYDQELNLIVKPQLDGAIEAEKASHQLLQTSESRINELLGRSGRFRQFADTDSRDQWLNNQIDKVKNEINLLERFIHDLKEEVLNYEADVANNSQDVDNCKSKITDINTRMIEIQSNLSGLSSERSNLIAKIKDFHRQEASVFASLENIRETKEKENRHLFSQIPRGIAKSLDLIMDLSKNKRLEGIYGPVIDLFSTDPALFSAVESIAKNQLFHVVVEDDDVVSSAIKILQRHKTGRITFVPLSSLRPPPNISVSSEDYFSLLSRLNFEEKFRPVFSQIFGKSLVCRDLELAVSVSSEKNADCVTIDGDLVSRKGVLTGGYNQVRTNRLSIHHRLQESRHQESETERDLNQLESNRRLTEEQLSTLVANISILEQEKNKLRSELESLSTHSSTMTVEIDRLKSLLSTKQSALESSQSNLIGLNRDLSSFQSELGKPLKDKLSSEESRELTQLKSTVETIKNTLPEKTKKRVDLETQFNRLKAFLSSNLLLRKSDMESKIANINSSLIDLSPESNINSELTNLNNQIQNLDAKIQESRDSVLAFNSSKLLLEDELDSLKSASLEYGTALQTEGQEVERLFIEKNSLLTKKDELQRKIRDLGSVSLELTRSFSEYSTNALNLELSKVNMSLKKFSHVNKKALEQFVNFTEKRDQMLSKRQELIDGERSIKELVEHLDHQKDACVESTFAKISENFAQVFTEIVPNGYGYLEAIKNNDNQMIGISVKVSFTGRGDVFLMEQLSGGQKSIVALSLIFSIQKCDLAPFYLFDELDAALDDQYRLAVARLISKMSRGQGDTPGCQVICTTFRPEIIEHGDRHYLVSLRNKVSTIRVASAEDCLDLIRQLPENAPVPMES
ncbi:hypothetical protein RCL1_002572 [Eukaryota sp. TZLM3-RCL]